MKSKKPDSKGPNPSSLSDFAACSEPTASDPVEPTPAANPIAPTLPSWKAFVIQLTHDTTPESGIFAGRVEHLRCVCCATLTHQARISEVKGQR